MLNNISVIIQNSTGKTGLTYNIPFPAPEPVDSRSKIIYSKIFF